MGSGSFNGEEQTQHVQVCRCRCDSLQEDIRAFIRKEFDDLKGFLLSHLAGRDNDSSPHASRSQPHQSEISVSKRLYLRIKDDCLPEALYTLNKIKDQVGSLTVELLDEFGSRVEDGPESSAKIKLVVLNGDFPVENNDWTEEDVNKNVVLPRKDKPALLKGRCEVSLIGGVANVGDFSFTDNSKRSGSVRLAAQVVKAPFGVDIRAGISRDFTVKERRLLCDIKHKAPSPTAELWRLKNISRVGQIYERAKKSGIYTVKDFLQLYNTDPEKIRGILEVTSEAKWNEIVDNAKACKSGSELYTYYDNTTGAEIHLDSTFNILGVSFGGHICHSLDENLKNKLRYEAYERRGELVSINTATTQMLAPSTTMQPTYVTAPQQVQHPNRYMTGPGSGHLEDVCGLLEIQEEFQACMEVWDSLNDPTPEIGGRFDIPTNNTRIENKPPSKLMAAYYVTKAANIFMIALQNGQNPITKKRKLQ